MLKAQLEANNESLRSERNRLENNDRILREQFTKCLRHDIGYSDSNRTMSWEQIFFHIGELAAQADQKRHERYVMKLDETINELNRKVEKYEKDSNRS